MSLDNDQLKEDEDARKSFLTCAVVIGIPILIGTLCSTWVVVKVVTFLTEK